MKLYFCELRLIVKIDVKVGVSVISVALHIDA